VENKIEIIYADNRFERIRYYLREKGFDTLEDLVRFSFDELMFVPGISEADIRAAKEIYFSIFCNISNVPDELALLLPDKRIGLDNGGAINHQDEKKKYTAASDDVFVYDALIADVYSGVPRSAAFIKACQSSGKEFMSQLTDADFDEAMRIKGLGITSAENLRSVYINYLISSEYRKNAKKDHKLNEISFEVSTLPLSVRAKNGLGRAGVNSLNQLLSLNKLDLLDISNIGTKTCKEILEYIQSNYSSDMNSERIFRLEGIDNDNKKIPLSLLKSIGVNPEGIEMLLNNGLNTVEDLCTRNMSPSEYALVRPAINYLSISIITHFKRDVTSLKDRAKTCMLRRCSGATLQEIGNEIGVTRERVRQIIAKSCRLLLKSADMIAGMLFSLNNNAFTYINLHTIFLDEQLALLCKLALLESEYAIHFVFSDKFVRADICPYDIAQVLREFVHESIDEGLNFYDSLEFLESELTKRSLSFFDFEDIMNYLLHNRYHFYGDYVTKVKQSYGRVCYDAVNKFFAFDIKLNSDENNEDMRLLRQIIAKHYQGLKIPPDNRALTAAMTRNTTKLVLSGRGRYCPFEKVVFSAALFEDVRQFIHNSQQTSFYYSELYTHFEGRFLAETNIHNFHFLHGMLKCLFPNEFTYERDLLVKTNSLRQDVNDRLIQLLKQQGHALTKKDIHEAIPGINDFVIYFSVMRLPEVIQWDYNELNHIENLNISSEDIVCLRNIIKNQTEIHSGYCSDSLLFSSAKEKCQNLFENNSIKNAQNLFYIASYYLGNEYRFRKPHIVTLDFPIQELSIVNITRVLLNAKDYLNYDEYFSLAETLGWANGTLYIVFSEIEKDYIRVSENEYRHKYRFVLPRMIISSLSHVLQSLILSSDFYSFSSIFNYDIFPECGYQWNGFLLESIITEYDTGFRIIYPQIRDRRYLRGIIVSEDSQYDSFDDLVVGILKKNSIRSISESGLEKFLRNCGIITNTLPHELYKSSGMQFKDETFYINKQSEQQ